MPGRLAGDLPCLLPSLRACLPERHMPADLLMSNATADTEGADVTLRSVGTQVPPARMSIQIAITGKAKVQIQGRLHRLAPWADIGHKREHSCLFYIDPISSLRAVSTETGPESSVSVWAAWNI
jgi:hypothetical protein